MVWLNDSFINYFDYFQQPIKIMFNRTEKVSTYIGCFFSLITFGVSLALAISMGADIYNRINPTVAYTTTTQDDVPIFNVTNANLRYIVVILDSYGIPFRDPRYFTLNILFYQNIRYPNSTVSTTRTPFNQVNCSIHYDYFNSTNHTNEYATNLLSEGFCFDPSNTSIGGSYLNEYFSNINYQVFKCVNSTANNNSCKPLSEINAKIYNSKFQIYYFDSYVDTNNYETPIITYFNDYFIKMDPGMYKYSNLYLKKTTVESDAGLIFQSKQYYNDLMTDYFREQYLILQNNQIINFYMNISNNFLEVKRNYSKLQNLAATVGGIFSVLTVFAELISSFFVKYKIYEMLFNTLFYINENEERRKSISVSKTNNKSIAKHQLNNLIINNNDNHNIPVNKSQSSSAVSILMNTPKSIASPIKSNNYLMKIEEINSNNNNSNNNNNDYLNKRKKSALMNILTDYKRKSTIAIPEEDNNMNKNNNNINANINANIIKKINNNNNRKYKLGIIKILKIKMSYCCNNTNNNKHRALFNEAYRKLTKYLDFLDFVKVIQDLQNLKKIIFNKSQQELFKYVNKPIIEHQQHKYKQSKQLIDVEYFMKCYSEVLVNKENESKKDKRLIEQLDKNIKALI